MSACGYGQWRDLNSAQVLEDQVWHGGSGDGDNEQGEDVGVPSLVPKSSQCSARVPGGWFAEAWRAL